MNYDTIEEAYHFVNNGKFGERRAFLHRTGGKIYYTSTVADYGDLPADLESSHDYIALPQKKDLPLGISLSLEFVEEYCPEQLPRVAGIFARKAAYRNFKELLTSLGLIESWYLYEERREGEALQIWCREQGLRFG